jgi:hypothetical protein
MPIAPQFHESSNGNLSEIAARLRGRMCQLKLSTAELARRCETFDLSSGSGLPKF